MLLMTFQLSDIYRKLITTSGNFRKTSLFNLVTVTTNVFKDGFFNSKQISPTPTQPTSFCVAKSISVAPHCVTQYTVVAPHCVTQYTLEPLRQNGRACQFGQ